MEAVANHAAAFEKFDFHVLPPIPALEFEALPVPIACGRLDSSSQHRLGARTGYRPKFCFDRLRCRRGTLLSRIRQPAHGSATGADYSARGLRSR